MHRKIAAVLILLVISVIAEGSSVPEAKASLEKVKDGRKCTCMNWRSCHGEINSDVDCFQSYLQVCCVLPDPHTEPSYKVEGRDNNDNDVREEIRIIHV